MTQDEIIQFAAGLPGTVVVTAGEETGAPEPAWGDTFISYDPHGDAPADRFLPFATIVTKDYEGFDTASDLNRPGVFRLNLAVGRRRFEELLGYPPAAAADHRGAVDFTVTDRLLPHPAYAVQGWVCVLDPGERTAVLARSLLEEAHARAAGRLDRTRPDPA
ncbi:DUF6194 family protein [Actinoallomurus spadix]|uniref:DUF6194 domain-containing protein n=1 Tax=Actinoallomurus spadix TaxID=79912 RepID=A0ABN0W5D8_9ACTN|nr:DUF6194 family protein [Actinoallomurus spadix]MCO5986116.1 DUF6194 family protein [Actinoallomurus spadix]